MTKTFLRAFFIRALGMQANSLAAAEPQVIEVVTFKLKPPLG